MRNAMQTVTTINLEPAQLLVLESGHRGRVRVLCGAAWLTEEGDTDDTLLCAGSEHVFSGRRALIEALGAARVQIEDAPASVASRLAGWLRSMRHDARAAVARLQLVPAPSL